MDIFSPKDGFVVELMVAEGASVQPGIPLLKMDTDDEDRDKERLAKMENVRLQMAAQYAEPEQIASGGTTSEGGAKYTGLHALRHSYASWCINRREDGGLGLTPKLVQGRLGHSTIGMTLDVYGHLFPRGDDGSEPTAVMKISPAPFRGLLFSRAEQPT